MGVFCLMTSCLDERFENVTPTPGKEVLFSAYSNSGVCTKTNYGGLIDTDADEIDDHAIVNWVHGDYVTVYGESCSIKQAKYSVNTNNATNLNYAISLDKTANAGVQWGEDGVSDFYAVYPSSESYFTSTDNGAKIRTTIRSAQTNYFHKDQYNNWIGNPYGDNLNNLTMRDAIMYAYTNDAVSAKNGVPQPVDLNFKPFSTVLNFRFMGYDYDSTIGEADQTTVYINKITLTAPETVKIAGDFDLEIKRDGSAVATPTADATNVITVYPDHLPLDPKKYVDFNIFTIPLTGLELSADWKLKIETSHGNFTCNLKPKTGTNGKLAAGKIHRMRIPSLSVKKEGKLYPNEWIKQIPRNVYLSELSVPGSWYCTDANYSGTTDLNTLYSKGVRAFHIDCRLSKTAQWLSTYSDGDTDVYLACAGTEGLSGIAGYGKIKEGDYVLKKLQTLASLALDNPQEFIVVVLTIAESPFNDSGRIFGTVKPQYVLPEIQNVLNDKDVQKALFKSTITSSTTVNEVLGTMIVKVNANCNNFTSYFNGSALVSTASLAQSNDGDIVVGVFDKMQEKSISWGKTATDLTFYYHQAQRTADNVSGVPTFAKRKKAIDDIIHKSDSIYRLNKHNGWFQLGVGGFKKNSSGSENHTVIADTLNRYVNNWIVKKLAAEDGLAPSPLGLVLMNYPTNSNYYGPTLIESILKMNTRFTLNRNWDAKEWPNGKPTLSDGTTGDTNIGGGSSTDNPSTPGEGNLEDGGNAFN